MRQNELKPTVRQELNRFLSGSQVKEGGRTMLILVHIPCDVFVAAGDLSKAECGKPLPAVLADFAIDLSKSTLRPEGWESDLLKQWIFTHQQIAKMKGAL